MLSLIFKLIIVFIAHFSYANQDNHALAFSFSNRSDCVKAMEHANYTGDEILKKIIITRSILDNKCNNLSFYNVTKFVQQNNNWSQNPFIKKRLEELIDDKVDKAKLFAWFKQNLPQTPYGFKHYAFAALHSKVQEVSIFKQAWVKAHFEHSEYQNFLKAHRNILTQDDHIARIEYLLWHDRAKEATQMLNLIDKNLRNRYLARIAIANNSPDSERIFAKLAKQDKYNSGVLYSYLKYKRSLKKSITEDEIKLAIQIPVDLNHSDLWWPVRNYYVREFIKLKQYKQAYKLAKQHNCSIRLHITQAEWLCGWLCLRFLNNPKMALTHFENIYNNSSRPITKSRGAYWMARAYKALGDKKNAQHWFTQASCHGHTFYGQLAQCELKYKALKLKSNVTLTEQDLKRLVNLDGPKIIELLLKYNQDWIALAYIKSLFNISQDPAYISYILDKIKDYSNISFKVEVAREAAFYGVFAKDHGYPVPFDINIKLDVEKPLVYSIIRQESSFDQYAVDPTDGRGLMQLIPPTAKMMAKSLKIDYNEQDLLINKEYNIMLGSKNLADHVNYYNGSYVLAVSAYNAGKHRVDRWIQNNGDPRNINQLYELLDWIEKIPFSTTRDYVHRILENLQIYRSIINKNDSLHILKDLTRKKVNTYE